MKKHIRIILSAFVGSCLVFGAGTAIARDYPSASSKSKHSVHKKASAKVRAQTSGARLTRVKATEGASPERLALAEKGTGSLGRKEGLHRELDPLALKSAVAFVEDLDSKQVLFSKNAQAVLPIASITKLMTSLVIIDAKLPLDETISITEIVDVDNKSGRGSRLPVGTQLTRGEVMHLALMASENRAAFSLGASYPGGIPAFVAAMNAKARELGMSDSHFVEPTGLSSSNVSSGPDLAKLVNAAYKVPQIRQYSTSTEHTAYVRGRPVQFRNTNALVKDDDWNIGLSKTGFINAAGRCLVMQAQINGRRLAIVLLDSLGKYSRLGDANRIKKFLETSGVGISQGVPARQGEAHPKLS